GASDLEFQPFAQAIVSNYGISGVSCKSDLDRPLSRQYAQEGVGPSDPQIRGGLANTGAKVTITTGGFLYSDTTVEKAAGEPTFDYQRKKTTKTSSAACRSISAWGG